MENEREEVPPKCCPKCGSKETKMIDINYGNPGEIHEYTLVCNDCGTYLGYWGYGHWEY